MPTPTDTMEPEAREQPGRRSTAARGTQPTKAGACPPREARPTSEAEQGGAHAALYAGGEGADDYSAGV
jgi:hypothetical protein